MKLGIIVLCFSVYLSIDAMESHLFKKVTPVGNVAVKNISMFLEAIDDVKNFRNFNDELDVYSVIKELLITHSDWKIDNRNLTKECQKAGMNLLLPIIEIPDWEGRIKKLLSSPVGKMLDAWGKIPERILLGNVNLIGAYDECSKLIDAKYCSSTMKLMGMRSGSYGSCFPKVCTSEDVAKVLAMTNNYTKGLMTFDKSSKGTFCDKAVDYSTGVVCTFFLMFLLLFLCFVGTVIDIYQASSITKTCFVKEALIHANNGTESESAESNNYAEPTDQQVTDDDLEKKEIISPKSTPAMENDVSLRSPSMKTSDEKVQGNGLANFFTCFSILKNTKAILSTYVADGSITSINGIRVLSLTWVILGHVYIVTILGGQADNGLVILNTMHRFTFLAISNAYVAVDTFFVLSGLLVSYLTLRRIDKKGMGCADILVFYVHRYIRLTPSLGLAILFYTNILPIIITGPRSVFLSQTDSLTKSCYDYWWSTLLYFNNFYPEGSVDMCIGWSWYLSNDMQFYILSPAILLLMVFIGKLCRRPMKAILFNFLVILWLCFLSILITGVITGVYDIPALMSALFLPNNPRIKQADMIMDRIYVKPYCRVTPYLIGLFLGYLFSRNVTLEGNLRKRLNVIGWVTAVVVGILVVYGPWSVFKENGKFFSNAENIIYSACHRFAWGCAVAWVIYACHNKAGGLVNVFLSWKVWIPLSRLTYGSYLLHFIVLEYFLFTRDVVNHYQDSTAIFDFISVTVISYASAFILAVCLEYPVLNLEKKLFKR